MFRTKITIENGADTREIYDHENSIEFWDTTIVQYINTHPYAIAQYYTGYMNLETCECRWDQLAELRGEYMRG